MTRDYSSQLGPRTDTEAEEFAVEELIADVQYAISLVMEDQKVSRAALAKNLGRSESTVSRALDGRANLTLKTIAKIFHALGDKFHVSSRHLKEMEEQEKIVSLYGQGAQTSKSTSMYQEIFGEMEPAAYTTDCLTAQMFEKNLFGWEQKHSQYRVWKIGERAPATTEVGLVSVFFPNSERVVSVRPPHANYYRSKFAAPDKAVG